MHSFDVYIVDLPQKVQSLKFFAIFWSNCNTVVILKSFSTFCKKQFLKVALMNWKWYQLSWKCVFWALWCSRAKLDWGGNQCPPCPGKPFQMSVWLGLRKHMCALRENEKCLFQSVYILRWRIRLKTVVVKTNQLCFCFCDKVKKISKYSNFHYFLASSSWCTSKQHILNVEIRF